MKFPGSVLSMDMLLEIGFNVIILYLFRKVIVQVSGYVYDIFPVFHIEFFLLVEERNKFVSLIIDITVVTIR